MNINFACIHIKESTRAIPLGAAMVAGNLKKYFKDSLNIKIIDCYQTDSLSVNMEKIKEGDPECICFSLYLWNVTNSLALISKIKNSSPDTITIIGGPMATALLEDFTDNANIDYVFRGEAEESAIPFFQSILDERPLDSSIINQGLAPDINSLPSPYLQNILDLKKYNGALWELSRGCPFNCSFCFESRGNKEIRRFSLERIKKELELFNNSEIAEVFVLDPTFNYNKTEAKSILQAIAETAPDIHFSFEIRAEFLDEEMAELFSHLHCTLQIGLQSTDIKVLKNINRSFSRNKFNEKIMLLHEAEVPYGFDLIYGLPEDTIEGFLKSLDFVLSLAPNHVDIFPLAVLPGTELYEKAETFALNFNPDNSYIVNHSPSFPVSDMSKAGKIADAVDLFYNQGKAVTWMDLLLSFLEITPSTFFSLIAGMDNSLKKTSPVLEYQLIALEFVFEKSGVSDTAELIKSLVSYFHYTNSDFPCGNHEISFNKTYIINSQLQVASFSYNPLSIVSLIEQGVNDFKQIKDLIKPEKTNLVMYVLDFDLTHYICSEKEYNFLKAVLSNDEEKLRQFIADRNTEVIIEDLMNAGILAKI